MLPRGSHERREQKFPEKCTAQCREHEGLCKRRSRFAKAPTQSWSAIGFPLKQLQGWDQIRSHGSCFCRMLGHGTVQGAKSWLQHVKPKSTSRLLMTFTSLRIQKLSLGSNYVWGSGGGIRVPRMGMGGSGEQRKLRSQQVRGQLSWPSVPDHSGSFFHLLASLQYTARRVLLSPRDPGLESSRPGCLESSTWVFLGLERNRYAVLCRLPGPGVTRNLLTKCYNFFTMTRQCRHWDSAGQSEERDVTCAPITAQRFCLPTRKRKREIGDSSTEQLRRSAAGPRRPGAASFLSWMILGRQETHLLVTVIRQQSSPGK